MDNLVAAYLPNLLLDLACAAGMGKVLGSLTRKGYLLRVLGTKPEQYMVANRPPLWLVSSNSQSKGGS